MCLLSFVWFLCSCRLFTFGSFAGLVRNPDTHRLMKRRDYELYGTGAVGALGEESERFGESSCSHRGLHLSLCRLSVAWLSLVFGSGASMSPR